MAHVLAAQRLERGVATAVDPAHQHAPAIVRGGGFEDALVGEFVHEIGAVSQAMASEQQTSQVRVPGIGAHECDAECPAQDGI